MVGDVGNMGNVGNVGNVGSLGSGGSTGWLVPDRLDVPFVTMTKKVWDANTRTWADATGANPDLRDVRVAIPAWRDQDWGANWWAWQVLLEFAPTAWQNFQLTDWTTLNTANEIAALITAAEDERPDALGEILAQNEYYTDIAAFFMATLRITGQSHPNTYRLLHIAGLIGIMVSMHYKRVWNRPRPSQLAPALLPPVAVPGHAAYPSGHALQAVLMALALNEALAPANGNTPKQTALQPVLMSLAWRIARNREIAGLHYQSDTNAGTFLAEQVFPLLLPLNTYQPIRDLAEGELQ